MTNLLSKEELVKLTTPRLLAYKNKLMQVPETTTWGESTITFISKEHPRWQETYASLKEILSTREHVEKA